jgi:hypothetical protein
VILKSDKLAVQPSNAGDEMRRSASCKERQASNSAEEGEGRSFLKKNERIRVHAHSRHLYDMGR